MMFIPLLVLVLIVGLYFVMIRGEVKKDERNIEEELQNMIQRERDRRYRR
jgi:preprotein translocase subunit YajC